MRTRKKKKTKQRTLKMSFIRNDPPPPLVLFERQRASESSNASSGPFQPTASPLETNGHSLRRRYLVWNWIGVIIFRDEPSSSSSSSSLIDIDFHDAAVSRPCHFTNHHRFSLASLSSTGAVFASGRQSRIEPSSSSSHRVHLPSTLFFKGSNAWGPQADWTLQTDTEDIVAVACGSSFVACVTSERSLRLFTCSGFQRHLLTLPGSIVSLVGHEDRLFLVYSSSSFTSSEEVTLYFWWMDTQSASLLAEGHLAVSPGSSLVWIGCVEQHGYPITCDARGIVRLLRNEGSPKSSSLWIPVADTRLSMERFHANTGSNAVPAPISNHSNDHSFWMIGVTADYDLLGVVCKGGMTSPSVMPRPMTTTLPMRVSLWHNDTTTGDLEERWWRTMLLQQQKKKDDNDNNNNNDLREDGRKQQGMTSPQQQAAMDSDLLKLIQIACTNDKTFRALDLTTLLQLPKSFDIAVRIAAHHRLVVLAEKMMQAKQKQMSMTDTISFNISSANVSTANISTGNTLSSNMSSANITPANVSSTNITPMKDTFIKRETSGKESITMETGRQEDLLTMSSPATPKVNPFASRNKASILETRTNVASPSTRMTSSMTSSIMSTSMQTMIPKEDQTTWLTDPMKVITEENSKENADIKEEPMGNGLLKLHSFKFQPSEGKSVLTKE